MRNMRNNGIELKKIFPRKLVRNVEDYGTRIAFQKTLKYLTQPIYREIGFIIYEIDIFKGSGKDIVNKDIEFKMIRSTDRAAVIQIEDSEEWLKGCLSRKLETNGLCMVALDKGKLAGFNLATRGVGFIKLLKLKIMTEADEAWSEHIAIMKDYRGRKLANDLRNRFYQELVTNGIKSLYGHRQEFNVASKGSAKKYTANEICKATYRKALGSRQLSLTGIDSQMTPKVLIAGASGEKEYPFSIHIKDLKGGER